MCLALLLCAEPVLADGFADAAIHVAALAASTPEELAAAKMFTCIGSPSDSVEAGDIFSSGTNDKSFFIGGAWSVVLLLFAPPAPEVGAFCCCPFLIVIQLLQLLQTLVQLLQLLLMMPKLLQPLVIIICWLELLYHGWLGVGLCGSIGVGLGGGLGVVVGLGVGLGVSVGLIHGT